MCGLTGILAAKPRSPDDLRATVTAMADALRHRGPDGEGAWVGEGVALGHRRLSILDLSPAGAQPIHSACGRYVLSYNGEIYNHLDLRRALEQGGAAIDWRGHSDTETLLEAFAHWGVDATLARASGMFALALWDEKARRLTLARDRIGEKPLYWGWAGSAIVFGSELKALRRHPDFPTQVCPEALALYLRFAYVPAPRSIHPGVYKLEPGCVLEIEGVPPIRPPRAPTRPGETYGSVAIRRYWSLNDAITTGQRSAFTDDQDAMEAVERSLRAAVARQMLSDVPLGAFLSGGVDSSLIVALMQSQSSRPIKTFTVGFEMPGFNEAPFAAAIARHIGSDHTEMTVTEDDARNVIPSLPDLYDEPFADSSQIPTHLVCRAARSQVTVALTGDGGDEMFGGYYRHFWAPRIWERLASIPGPMRRALGRAMSAVPLTIWDRFGGYGAGVVPAQQLGDRAHKLARRLQEVESFDELYLSMVSEWPACGTALGVESAPASILDDPLPDALADQPIGRMIAQDLRTYLPDDILCKVDRAAMAVGLETRVPFLDPDLLATAMRVPLDMKIRARQGKWILRQALYRHVPQSLLDRPKAGFGIPVGDWLRGPLKSWADDLLSPQQLRRDGLIDPAPVENAWAEHRAGRRDWTPRIWIVLMLQAWRGRIGS